MVQKFNSQGPHDKFYLDNQKSRVGYVCHMIHIWWREKNIRRGNQKHIQSVAGITDEEDVIANADI